MDRYWSRSFHISPTATVPFLPQGLVAQLFLWLQKLDQYQCLSDNRFLSIPPASQVSQSEVVVVGVNK